MNVVFHCGYDGKPNEDMYGECLFDNLSELVIREGGEPLKVCYDIEWCYHVYNLFAPSKSIAAPVIRLLAETVDGNPVWRNCDCLLRLLMDYKINISNPEKAERVFFRTVFPKGTAEYLGDSYVRLTGFLDKCPGVIRVLNNPLFHADPSATDKRLVEIATDDGVHFALDRIKTLPAPESLAREIALLNHGLKQPAVVEELTRGLTCSIAENMSDWGLM